MDALQAVIDRINELMKERRLNPNALANLAGVPQATVKSILNRESLNPGIVTLKKICDGFDNPTVSLADFFDTDAFRSLEQELK